MQLHRADRRRPHALHLQRQARAARTHLHQRPGSSRGSIARHGHPSAVTMPAYLIRHPAAQQREDILIEDPALTLTFHDGWAVFTDDHGIALAIPATHDAHIQRVDQPEEPAPQKE